ncbi:Sugar fermentation stimulation protein A [Aquimixticola soesokkakensis]|uniref:Sugar fermentation stimulation protein homolog n=1 Tax=Aquimixticola soesokkakensis TaxID=1519096 RepID=A0A1Y5RGG7_9RHOB|nr:DNA/RNA nuclease SfsA [Aquimixticola soesokkakensis]SLN16672.1 Sugar fermentation stimulation protein A [Aquimixticola soesokkakensis]
MRFQTPLIEARLLRRYKRFLADIRLPDGREVTAHCPNPGSMLGMAEAGSRIWVEPNDDPRKKLDYGWRLSQVADAMVVVDTGLANKVVGAALRAGQIDGLTGAVRAEVPYGEKSRVDFVVNETFVEVKSVTLSRQTGLAEFPDSKTARGAKHLAELAKLAQNGTRAVMLYLISRDDCSAFDLARDIDPAYGQAHDLARAAGVEILCYGVDITPQSITLGTKLP